MRTEKKKYHHSSRFNKPVRFVYSTTFLNRIIKKIQLSSKIAVDFEYDPYYQYLDRICLIQIGTPEEIYLIDTLRPSLDLSSIKALLEDPLIMKVFHDAQRDIQLLKKALAITPKNLFDTSIAARTLGIPQPSLKTLIDHFFNIRISKKESRADWSQRPLTREMETYAANDVRYLLEIGTILETELHALGLDEDVKELFEWIEATEPDIMEFNPDSFMSLPRAWDLATDELAILKELYLWRESTAKSLYKNAFQILRPSNLIKLAQAKPTTDKVLKQLISHTVYKKYQKEILTAINKGLNSPPIDPKTIATTRKWINKTAEIEQETLQKSDKQRSRHAALLNLRNKIATEQDKDKSLIIPKDVLMQLAIENPLSIADLRERPGFGKWRIKEYGEELINVLQHTNRDYSCFLCGKEFQDKTFIVKCPFCGTRFHLEDIIQYLGTNSQCPKCTTEISK